MPPSLRLIGRWCLPCTDTKEHYDHIDTHDSYTEQQNEAKNKTYNSGDSLVVTDPTTNPPVSGLTMGERTGSRIFHYLWSYVLVIETMETI